MNNIDFYVSHNGNKPLKVSIGSRVVEFELSDDWTLCNVGEMCDQCFGEQLDKNGMDNLISFLQILRNNMK